MSDELVKRLRHTLGSVSVDEHMHGDNLAILLCSFYEDAEGEIDDNGWTEVAVTGCERTLDAIHAHYADRIEALEAAIKRQSGAAATLRAITLAEVQDLKDMDRSEYNAAKTLDSERDANAILTAQVEALEAALATADELAEQCELFADGKLYSMNPVLEAREAYRQARDATT